MIACKSSELEKYLSFKNLLTNELENFIKCHPYFSNIARLKPLRDLKPIPSVPLGSTILSQHIQTIPLVRTMVLVGHNSKK